MHISDSSSLRFLVFGEEFAFAFRKNLAGPMLVHLDAGSTQTAQSVKASAIAAERDDCVALIDPGELIEIGGVERNGCPRPLLFCEGLCDAGRIGDGLRRRLPAGQHQ